MGISAIVGGIGRGVRTAWRGAIHWPVAFARWIRANPSRALAVLWLAGMATFVAITTRRAYRQYQREAAQRVAVAAPEKAGPPEVVEMMDVDEMAKIEIDRMHANGLGAAGEGTEVGQATIDAAREARARIAVVEGERVGGSGDVIVMTKGGIAGWIARNKDKKADPETLAWLRGEEAKDGMAAYASWANGDNSIAGWLARGKELHRGSGSGTTRPDADAGSAIRTGSGAVTGTGAESGSGSGSGSASAIARLPDTTPGSDRPQVATGSGSAGSGSATGSRSAGSASGSATGAGSGSAVRRGFDLDAIGLAARAAILPKRVVATLPEPTAAEVESMRARLPVSDGAARLEIAIRAHHIVIAMPVSLLFARGSTALTAAGNTLLHQLAGVLGTVEHRGLQIIAADGARAMEVAGTLVVAGIDVERISMAVAADPAKDGIDIALIAGGR